jgi:hypothetical protein
MQTFNPGERIGCQLRIYRAAAKDSEKDLTMQLQVYRDGNRVREDDWQPVAPRVQSRDDTGWVVSGELDSSGFSAGILELRITVKSPQANQTEHRSTYFEIRR